VRIVSLLPAATEIVSALGLGQALVARSHACDFPEDVLRLPSLTKARVDSGLSSRELDAAVRAVVAQKLPIYMLDEARLAALAPDVVVTQQACEVCAISFEQVRGSLKRTAPAARLVSLQPARLDDVLLDVQTVAAACDIAARGEALLAALRERLDRVAVGSACGAQPRVAVVEWLDPPMLAGHWIPDVIAAAGAIPLGPRAGEPSPTTTFDQLARLRPDVLVVAPCGFDLARTRAEAEPFLERLRALAPRLLLLDGNAFLNRPGPRLVDAVEMLARFFAGAAVAPQHGLLLDSVAAR
jgi:iron complex transport system substrate-binding protein